MAKPKIPLLNGFTREYLSYLFYCDSHKGILIRKVFKSSKALPGMIAGYAGKNDRYLRVRVDRERLTVHKIIYFIVTGKAPKKLDHKDRNGFNNRFHNLRPATDFQNCHNKHVSKVNTSGYKGVTYRWRVGNYEASIKAYGQNIYLGVFNTAKGAAKAYNTAAKKHFGKFAWLNDV